MAWLDDLMRKVAAFKRCEGGGKKDWCAKLRGMALFKDLSAGAFAEMCARMEAVPVRVGQVVVREGDDGDYYYVLVEGRAAVTRKDKHPAPPPPENSGEVTPIRPSAASGAAPKTAAKPPEARLKLAELEEGAGFGEEALISNNRRNATVTMLEDGTVMRLARRDFEQLLKEPKLRWYDPAAAAAEVRKGAAWLDCRSRDDKRAEGTLPGSVRFPIEEVRERASSLDRQRLYIAYCLNARLSATAAFILTQGGYRVGVLQGGLRGLG